MDGKPAVEKSVRELRAGLADVLNDAAVHGQITYVTSRGRRLAAVVPVPVAEAEERERGTAADEEPQERRSRKSGRRPAD